MDWYIRKRNSNDAQAFLEILGHVISYIPAEKRFQWLYQQNPHGKAITWLAIHSKTNQIIGCTSIFPKKYWVKDRVVLGCYGGDTFVDPKFRRKGIAKELHNVSLKEMGEYGINFQLGFPNDPNFGAFIKAGACHPGEFKKATLLLKSDPLFKRLNLNQKLVKSLSRMGNPFLALYLRYKMSDFNSPNGEIKKIAKFDSRFDELNKEIISSFNVASIRDSVYLNWRFFKKPLRVHEVYSYEQNGKLHGYAVLEYNSQSCSSFDFYLRNEEEIIRNFLFEIIRVSNSKNQQSINMLINPKGPYSKVLSKCGFKMLKHNVGKNFMILNSENNKYIQYLNKLENWYLTSADYDLEALNRFQTQKK